MEKLWKKLEELEQGRISVISVQEICKEIKKTGDPYQFACLTEILADKDKWFFFNIFEVLETAKYIETKDAAEEAMVRKSLVQLLIRNFNFGLKDLLSTRSTRIAIVILRAAITWFSDTDKGSQRKQFIRETVKLLTTTVNPEIQRQIHKTMKEIVTLREVPLVISLIPETADYYLRERFKEILKTIISNKIKDLKIKKELLQGINEL